MKKFIIFFGALIFGIVSSFILGFIFVYIYGFIYMSQNGIEKQIDLSEDYGFGMIAFGLFIISTIVVFPMTIYTSYRLLKKKSSGFINIRKIRVRKIRVRFQFFVEIR